MTSEQVVARLEVLEVDRERAEAGVRLAVTAGRLEAITGDTGSPWSRTASPKLTGAMAPVAYLRIPAQAGEGGNSQKGNCGHASHQPDQLRLVG